MDASYNYNIDSLLRWQVNIIKDIRKYVDIYPVLLGEDGKILQLLDKAYDRRPTLGSLEILTRPEVEAAISKFLYFLDNVLNKIGEPDTTIEGVSDEDFVYTVVDEGRPFFYPEHSAYLNLLRYDIDNYRQKLKIFLYLKNKTPKTPKDTANGSQRKKY